MAVSPSPNGNLDFGLEKRGHSPQDIGSWMWNTPYLGQDIYPCSWCHQNPKRSQMRHDPVCTPACGSMDRRITQVSVMIPTQWVATGQCGMTIKKNQGLNLGICVWLDHLRSQLLSITTLERVWLFIIGKVICSGIHMEKADDSQVQAQLREHCG